MRKILAGLMLVAVLTGCSVRVEDARPTTDTPVSSPSAEVTPEPTLESPAQPEPTPAPEPVVPQSSALELLGTLSVKGKAADSGYSREGNYGEAWLDVDMNGCRTRDDILKRDLYNILTTGGCRVESGILEDPYSGETIFFTRGVDTSDEVQIDHVVALKNSWLTGAQSWDQSTRIAFANDPLNLLAVKGSLNQQKSAGDAATWLPPRKEYRCTYIERQIQVKAKYGLWVTPAEKDAMFNVLSTCSGGQAIPTEETAVTETPAPVAEVPAGGQDPQFGSCKEAKANGFGPYVQGVNPEYDFYRDGDGDGTVCE